MFIGGTKPSEEMLKGVTITKKPLRVSTKEGCVGSMGTPEVFYYKDGSSDEGVIVQMCEASVGGVKYAWIER